MRREIFTELRKVRNHIAHGLKLTGKLSRVANVVRVLAGFKNDFVRDLRRHLSRPKKIASR